MRVWQDRARFLGLPILFTRYWIEEDVMHRRSGLLWIREDRLPIYRVLDVQVRKSPLDRLLGLGTVILYAADVTDSTLNLKGVRNPDDVANLIQRRADEIKIKHGIRGRELYGAFMGEFGHDGS